MKKIIILMVVLAHASVGFGGQIDKNVAENVGKNFLTAKVGLSSIHKSFVEFNHVYSAVSDKMNGEPLTYYYVFNMDSTGFVIVSAIDDVSPILAYSTEGIFDANNIPPNMAAVLEQYKLEMDYVVKNQIAAAAETKKQWNELANGQMLVRKSDGTSVEPLLGGLKWHQNRWYNDACPYDTTAPSDGNNRCRAGCVATAMAMIIKYWEYPTKGIGEKCYNANYAKSSSAFGDYGELCADFENTVYDYNSMPNQLTATNAAAETQAVATLIYHCGVALGMMYGPSASSANTAYTDYWIDRPDAMGNPRMDSRTALERYFGYAKANAIYKDSMAETVWIEIFKEQLNNRQPILYAGYSTTVGHAFVCDGYDENDYFHINWGFGGYYNCYCLVSSLVEEGYGIPGDRGDYSLNQRAIINIKPSTVSVLEFENDNNNAIAIYPNPTIGKLTIRNEKSGMSSEIEVFDVVGRKLLSHTPLTSHSSPLIEIDISHLANGLYFLKIDGKVFKVVKQ